MGNVRLDDITLDAGGEVDQALVKWRSAIEGAHTWDVSGDAEFQASGQGYSLEVKGHRGVVTAVVATGGIAARVNTTTAGTGNAVLWNRAAGSATLVVGETVTVYNTFAVTVPATTFIKVAPGSSGDYELIASDCF